MDYGNASCHNEFTDGQAQRMRAAINTQRAGLLQDECTPPCNDNIQASFTRDNAYPLSGDAINFTNTTSGASTYEWLIDGVVSATTNNFTHSFPSAGKYKVTLKAYNGSACFASYSHDVMVTCGVTARFYTDKQKIASKAGIFLESIQFTNQSENATSYQWIMSSNTGMAEQVISTSKDLNYVFQTPGDYLVKLIATNGTCSDTTEAFPIPVADPSADGIVAIQRAECFQQTKVRVTFFVCNYGYVSIPPKTPISFYDDDPRLATANKIGNSFYMPDSVTGTCCGTLYSHVVDAGNLGLNKIYAVFNDSGNMHPFALPNTPLIEKDYTNNITTFQNFAFKINVVPPSAVLEWHDTLQLKAQARPGTVSSYAWSSAKGLSCTNCSAPFLVADSTTTKRVIAVSNLGCSDTAFVDIQVPPYNDYAVTINEVQCAGTDSLYVNFTLDNYFKRGILPETLTVSFYNGNPLTGAATLLKPSYTLPDTIAAKQFTFSTFIKGMPTGNLYAVVNDSAISLPVNLPNTPLLEKNYLNNVSSFAYKPEALLIQPADTTVFRLLPLPLMINTPIYNPASTAWSTGSTYSLSCTACPNPVIIPSRTSVVHAQTENKYGCMLKGDATIKVFPPDMQVQIDETKCYFNTSALVTFTVCMNNLYDSVFANIPVSFYDADPVSGKGRLLLPVFYTPAMQVGKCYTYTTRVTAPTTGQLFAVVNDRGDSTVIPHKQYDETDYSNNIAQAVYTPFKIVITPSDTSIPRLTGIPLVPVAEGGTVSKYTWSPMQFLSCTSCASPVATPQYTMQYEVSARNEYSCTDTALAIIRTHTSSGVFIPDAFTPNSDNLNDVFYLLAGQDVNVIDDFSIFNRWGQKVFSRQNFAPNNPVFGWNGKLHGQDAQAGAYVYQVSATFTNGTKKQYKGTVVLIR
jgi:gliding motility-associated-like protein